MFDRIVELYEKIKFEKATDNEKEEFEMLIIPYCFERDYIISRLEEELKKRK